MKRVIISVPHAVPQSYAQGSTRSLQTSQHTGAHPVRHRSFPQGQPLLLVQVLTPSKEISELYFQLPEQIRAYKAR